MRITIFATAFLILIFLRSASIAQETTVDETVVLPDAIMQQVVNRIVRWHFRPGRTPRTVPVADFGIKREWLPAIKNVTFDLVDENDMLNYEKGVFRLHPIERDGRAYTINAGWELDCGGDGQTWKFTITDAKVRLWPTGLGWGRGCGGDAIPVIRGLKVGDISPNELPGYEFFTKGKLKDIRLGKSTREDMQRLFGKTCEGSCDYDENWEVWVNYMDERPWTQTTTTAGQTTKTEWKAKSQLMGTLRFVKLSPKNRVSFLRVFFPRRFARSQWYSIGDAWGENGFEGAVHSTIDTYTDGYGLSYEVYDKETFNNLKKERRTDDKLRKGDLISIEYDIPDALDDIIYDKITIPVIEN